MFIRWLINIEYKKFKKVVYILIDRWRCTDSTWNNAELYIYKHGSIVTHFILFILFRYWNAKEMLCFNNFEDNLNISTAWLQRHLLEDIWANFKIIAYKIYELLYKHPAYFTFISIIVNELLYFKVEAFLFFTFHIFYYHFKSFSLSRGMYKIKIYE